MSTVTAKGYARVAHGHVWHITQRCDKNEFLLSEEPERRRWLYWLYQAKRRYGLSVLNYVVTSNHVHLLVHDDGGEHYKQAMKMINAKTQGEFNRRQGRREPFWAAEFQSTAIQTDAHLARCVTYMDLNMVRAGVVDHPEKWRCGGYYESMNPPTRGARLDRVKLRQLLQFDTEKALQDARDRWIVEKADVPSKTRETYWSDSIAVGDLAFALHMKRALAFTHPGRRAQRERGCFAVR